MNLFSKIKKRSMWIKLLDTFAWVGGFHLALEQSIWKENVECIGFSEIDKFAKQVYSERFPGSKDLWSITDINIEKLEDFDLLTWWFPCQDVSVAWKQNLEWGRTVLVEYLLQILEKKQPKYFIFENVKGLYSKKFDDFRWSIIDRMTEAWYYVEDQILNTKDFWLPQNRERVFIVWWLNKPHKVDWLSHFEFPQWKELTTFLKDILEEEVDEKYYLKDEQYNKLSYDSIKRIYTDISPTLDTAQWWHRQSKIRIVNATKQGYIDAYEWDWIVLDNPNSKTKRGRVKSKISTEFVSNSQAYKQMWNAISVPVVKSIFDNLFKNE